MSTPLVDLDLNSTFSFELMISTRATSSKLVLTDLLVSVVIVASSHGESMFSAAIANLRAPLWAEYQSSLFCCGEPRFHWPSCAPKVVDVTLVQSRHD